MPTNTDTLTAEQAIALLPLDAKIHTVQCAGPILMGCDMQRDTLTTAVAASSDRALLPATHAPYGSHRLRINYRGKPLYIETEEASS